ncbi:MAG: glycosyltransferase 87 family protein [Anaerolineales bacterium]
MDNVRCSPDRSPVTMDDAGTRPAVDGQRWAWAAALISGLALVGFVAVGLLDTPATGLPQSSQFPGNDLFVYLRAGANVAGDSSPYVNGPWPDAGVYHYSPFLAVALSLLFRNGVDEFPLRAATYLYFALAVLAQPLAWWIWRSVFRAVHLSRADNAMILWAPLWLVYSQWFFDLTYLNVSTFWLCLAGALTWAVLRQRTGWVVLLVVVIALAKPHHVYPLLIPMLLGQWRWWLKVVTASGVGYGLTILMTFSRVGPDFGFGLYRDYLDHLLNIAERYPWTDHIFYNHSWRSILYWLFGFQTWVGPAVTAIRLLFLIPVLWLLWRWWQRPQLGSERRSQLALGICFAAHLWALMLVSDLWEAQLLIVVFAYLLAFGGPLIGRWAMLMMVPFSLLSVAQLAGWWIAHQLGRSFTDFDVVARLPVIMLAVIGIYLLLFTVLRSHLKTIGLIRH